MSNELRFEGNEIETTPEPMTSFGWLNLTWFLCSLIVVMGCNFSWYVWAEGQEQQWLEDHNNAARLRIKYEHWSDGGTKGGYVFAIPPKPTGPYKYR